MTCLTIRVVIMMPRKNVARGISQRNSASPLIFSVPKFKESHTRWARYFLCLTWHLTCAKTHLVNKTLPWLPCTPLLPQNDIYVFQSVDISSILLGQQMKSPIRIHAVYFMGDVVATTFILLILNSGLRWSEVPQSDRVT